MKIKIMSNALAEGLKCVLPAANAKSTVEVYANVKLEAANQLLSLTATNGNLTIHAKVDCQIEEEGATTMPMHLLSRIIATLPAGEVTLVEEENRMKITAGASKFNVTGLPVQMFPKMSGEEYQTTVTLNASDFRKLIKRTSYAQSPDDTRKTLQGLLVEIGDGKIRMVATDGRRLAINERNDVTGAEGELCRYIIPSSSVAAIQNFLQGDGEASVSGSGSMLMVSLNNGNQQLYTRLVDGVFPDYTQVIPKSHAVEVAIDRNELISAIQRVSVMAADAVPSMKTTFSDGMLVLSVIDKDIGNARDEIAIKYNGEKIEAFFSPRYLLDPLKTIDADDIQIELTDGRSPAKIKSKEDRFMYVLMPLRITDIN